MLLWTYHLFPVGARMVTGPLPYTWLFRGPPTEQVQLITQGKSTTSLCCANRSGSYIPFRELITHLIHLHLTYLSSFLLTYIKAKLSRIIVSHNAEKLLLRVHTSDSVWRVRMIVLSMTKSSLVQEKIQCLKIKTLGYSTPNPIAHFNLARAFTKITFFRYLPGPFFFAFETECTPGSWAVVLSSGS